MRGEYATCFGTVHPLFKLPVWIWCVVPLNTLQVGLLTQDRMPVPCGRVVQHQGIRSVRRLVPSEPPTYLLWLTFDAESWFAVLWPLCVERCRDQGSE